MLIFLWRVWCCYIHMADIKLVFSFGTVSQLEMGPDPTRAYFWPAVNKRPTRLQPGYFLTRPEGKKIEKFDVFRGNFNPNHKWLTRPEPQKIDPTWPGSKNFDPDPSLITANFKYSYYARQFITYVDNKINLRLRVAISLPQPKKGQLFSTCYTNWERSLQLHNISLSRELWKCTLWQPPQEYFSWP